MSTPPRVYAKISRILPKMEISTSFTKDHQEALLRARNAQQNRIPRLSGSFLERLKKDGGDKVLMLSRNFIHIDYTRFVPVCSDIKGLSLNEALLQLEWNRKQISKHMKAGMEEFIIKAKENGFDLEKTYVADAFVENSSKGLSKNFIKECLRGRGRYGATPHAKVCRLEVVLQEREKGFAIRENDPLEWIRVRLRQAKKDFTKSATEIYQESLKKPKIQIYN